MQGGLAIHHAAQTGANEAIQLLHKKGANIRAVSSAVGLSPLHRAAKVRRHSLMNYYQAWIHSQRVLLLYGIFYYAVVARKTQPLATDKKQSRTVICDMLEDDACSTSETFQGLCMQYTCCLGNGGSIEHCTCRNMHYPLTHSGGPRGNLGYTAVPGSRSHSY